MLQRLNDELKSNDEEDDGNNRDVTNHTEEEDPCRENRNDTLPSPGFKAFNKGRVSQFVFSFIGPVWHKICRVGR